MCRLNMSLLMPQFAVAWLSPFALSLFALSLSALGPFAPTLGAQVEASDVFQVYRMQHLRVTSASDTGRAQYTGWPHLTRGDTVVLALDDRATLVALSMSSVSRIDLERRSFSVVDGALALGGTVATGAFSVAMIERLMQTHPRHHGDLPFIALTAGMIASMPTAAFVGRKLHHSRWVTVFTK